MTDMCQKDTDHNISPGKPAARLWLRQTAGGLVVELGAVPLGAERRLRVQLPGGGAFTALPTEGSPSEDVHLEPPASAILPPEGGTLEVVVRPVAYRTIAWSCSIYLPALSDTPYTLTVCANCPPEVSPLVAPPLAEECRLDAAWRAAERRRQYSPRPRGRRQGGDEDEEGWLQTLLPPPPRGPPSCRLLAVTGQAEQQADEADSSDTARAWAEAREGWRRERAVASSRRPRVGASQLQLLMQEIDASVDRGLQALSSRELASGLPPSLEEALAVQQPTPLRRRMVHPSLTAEEQDWLMAAIAPQATSDADSSVVVEGAEMALEHGARGRADARWLWRRRALERFARAARRVVLRDRLLRRLRRLREVQARWRSQAPVAQVGGQAPVSLYHLPLY